MVKISHNNETYCFHAGRDEIIPYRLMKSEWIDFLRRGCRCGREEGWWASENEEAK